MQKSNSILQPHQNRRGIAILWLILWGAMFLTFFCVVLEISSMWQAQVELKNTMDAAALAAVREWGLSGGDNTQVARNVGIAYMEGNPVQGSTVTVANDNYNAGNINQNASLHGSFVFGALETATQPPTHPIYFNPSGSGGCGYGNVTITIHKPDSGSSTNTEVNATHIEVDFTSSDISNLKIQSIKFILPDPVVPGNDNKNAAYYHAIPSPQVSQDPAYYNTSALYVAPGSGGDFYDPNDTGAIGFTFDGPSTDGDINHSQSVTLHFSDTIDPSGLTILDPGYNPGFREGYFFHFGVSTHNLKNPGYPGPQSRNDGDAWGNWGVIAEITFLIPGSPDYTDTVQATFINTGDPDDGISKAFFTGAGGGGYPAVISRASKGAQGFCSQMLGVSLFQVSATSVAYFDCSNSRTYLVNIENFPSLSLPTP